MGKINDVVISFNDIAEEIFPIELGGAEHYLDDIEKTYLGSIQNEKDLRLFLGEIFDNNQHRFLTSLLYIKKIEIKYNLPVNQRARMLQLQREFFIDCIVNKWRLGRYSDI